MPSKGMNHVTKARLDDLAEALQRINAELHLMQRVLDELVQHDAYREEGGEG